MKKNSFHWGKGIALFISLFIIFLLVLVYISFQQKINLVSRDYYPKELEHTKHMEKLRNTAQLDVPVHVAVDMDSLVLIYPKEINSENTIGRIQLYYFVDFIEDKYYKMEPGLENKQKIPLTGLKKGRYKVILDWVTNGVEYYYECEIQN